MYLLRFLKVGTHEWVAIGCGQSFPLFANGGSNIDVFLKHFTLCWSRKAGCTSLHKIYKFSQVLNRLEQNVNWNTWSAPTYGFATLHRQPRGGCNTNQGEYIQFHPYPGGSPLKTFCVLRAVMPQYLSHCYRLFLCILPETHFTQNGQNSFH